MKEITVSDDFAEVVKKWEKYSDLSEATALLLAPLQRKEKEAKIKDIIAEINERLKELKELGCTFESAINEEPIVDNLIAVFYDEYLNMGILDLLP